jgi:hypothetical protein
MLSRMDLRVQIHDRTAMWKQVCDGKFIWTESRVPDEEKTLARADGEPGYSTRLDRVDLAEALEKQGLVRDSDAPPAGAVSGLPQLLRTLAGVFDFAPPRSILMRSPDGKWVDVWLLEGQWDPGVLGELLPEQGRAIKLGAIDLGLLPPRMPDRVKVYLGQKRSGPWLGALTSDRPPPPDLFPFRIEYGRQDAETDEVAQVLNLEVYDVVFDDDKLRPDKFTFKSSRKHRNATSRFVRALQRSVRAAK